MITRPDLVVIMHDYPVTRRPVLVMIMHDYPVTRGTGKARGTEATDAAQATR